MLFLTVHDTWFKSRVNNIVYIEYFCGPSGPWVDLDLLRRGFNWWALAIYFTKKELERALCPRQGYIYFTISLYVPGWIEIN